MADKRKKPAFDFDEYGARPDQGKDDLPIWVDYIELLCIFHQDQTITRGEILDVVFNEGNEIAPSINEADEIRALLDESGDEDTEDGPIEFNEEALPSTNIALLNDTRSVKITDWYNNACSRSNLYRDNYPFNVDMDNYVIKLKPDLTEAHRLYLYLLLTGSLRLFSSKLITNITTDFELLCLQVQKAMFPLQTTGIVSETHCFGKNQAYTGSYGSKLSDKLTWLGNEINSDALNVSIIPNSNKGDRGIDILSFYKFLGDNVSGTPVILAQCACSYDDWQKKQSDHSPTKYVHFNLFYYEYIRMMYIPFHYRDSNGKWFNQYKLETVVLDRYRIVQSLLDVLGSINSIIEKWVQIIFEHPDSRKEYASTL